MDPLQFMDVWMMDIVATCGYDSPNQGVSALNYYAGVTVDDGSCVYVAGCTDDQATNYNSLADFDDGSCTY